MAHLLNDREISDYENNCVTEVTIDVKVVLQIIKHGSDGDDPCEHYDGFITGLRENNSTHVTNVFRKPSDIETDDDYTATVQNYQNLYLQAFKDYDLEQEIVGFYKKASDMNIFSKVDDLKDWIEFQISADKNCMKGCVFIVYDEHRMSCGDFGMRAYRVSTQAIELYEKSLEAGARPFSLSTVKKNELNFEDILDELPINIKSSNLMNCLLLQMENERLESIENNATGNLNSQICRNKFGDELYAPAYTLACTSNIEAQTEKMKESVEEVSKETKRFLDNQRNLYAATNKKNQIMSAKRLKNEQLEKEGKEPEDINETDIDKQVRMPEEYNRLPGLVLSYQSNIYSDSVKNISAGNIGKLFVADKLQDE